MGLLGRPTYVAFSNEAGVIISVKTYLCWVFPMASTIFSVGSGRIGRGGHAKLCGRVSPARWLAPRLVRRARISRSPYAKTYTSSRG